MPAPPTETWPTRTTKQGWPETQDTSQHAWTMGMKWGGQWVNSLLQEVRINKKASRS